MPASKISGTDALIREELQKALRNLGANAWCGKKFARQQHRQRLLLSAAPAGCRRQARRQGFHRSAICRAPRKNAALRIVPMPISSPC